MDKKQIIEHIKHKLGIDGVGGTAAKSLEANLVAHLEAANYFELVEAARDYFKTCVCIECGPKEFTGELPCGTEKCPIDRLKKVLRKVGVLDD